MIARFCPGLHPLRKITGCGNAKLPRKEPLHPWPRPPVPWERLHIDFAGPMNNDFFLVLVDAHSDWPEIRRMRSTTAEKTIEVIEQGEGGMSTTISPRSCTTTGAAYSIKCSGRKNPVRVDHRSANAKSPGRDKNALSRKIVPAPSKNGPAIKPKS